jgi:DNA-directed RNA polymerase subunit beta'
MHLNIIKLKDLDLPEVTNSTIKKKKIFTENGTLFDEAIFGPIRDYKCKCPTVIVPKGERCPKCGVKITSSLERRTTLAKIKLNTPIIHPFIYKLLTKQSKQFNKIIKGLYKGDRYKLEDNKLVKDPEGEYDLLTNPEEFFTLLLKNEKHFIAKIILDNIDKLMAEEIIVLPPELRPFIGNVIDDLNALYSHIITYNNKLNDSIVDVNDDKTYREIILKYKYTLQYLTDQIYDHVYEKLKGKKGLFRKNILGKRIDWSGRAVIIPNPTIPLTHCRISYLLLMELFKLQLANRLKETGKYRHIQMAIEEIEKAIEKEDTKFVEDLKEVVKDEFVMLNRQPSLHRMSIMAFKIDVGYDYCIGINPLINVAYNADHDGDSMAIYVPVTAEAKKECEEKVWTIAHYLSPATNDIIFQPNQDIILGIYQLTRDDKTEKDGDIYERIVIEDNIETTKGRFIFNQILPKDFGFINETLTKNKLKQLMIDIVNVYYNNKNLIQDIYDNIKKLGFKFSTLYPVTLDMEMFDMGITRDYVENNIYNSKDLDTNAEKENALLENLKEKFGGRDMIESGARGSWKQAKQLFLSRGYVANSKGQILDKPIISNNFIGLTEEEYFNSCYGTRKGLIDTAENTSESGYLTRILIYATSTVELGKSDDCGADHYFEFTIDTPQRLKQLVGRYYLDDETNTLKKVVTQDINLVGKTIKLRSPIYCKNTKICKTCYGDFHQIVDSKYIGIVASQALGEILTQLVLRTFHISGAASIKKGSSKNEDVISHMDILKDILLRRNINKDNVPESLNKILEIYDNYKKLQLVHFEVVLSQLLWYKTSKHSVAKLRQAIYNVENFTPQNIIAISLSQVPVYESWVTSILFQNVGKNLVRGLIEKHKNDNILVKILTNKITN